MMRSTAVVVGALVLTACNSAVTADPEVPSTYTWSIGELGVCDAPGFCGAGTRSRPVACVSDGGTVVSDGFCTGPRPVSEESCVATAGCLWQADPAGDCNAPSTCSAGSETRVISCRDYLGTEVDASWCSGPKPDAVGGCLRRTGCTWAIGVFGACDVDGCGEGTRSRSVACLGVSGETVADGWCPSPLPTRVESCSDFSACALDISPWSACSAGCGYGMRTRTVTCENPSGDAVNPSWCSAAVPPTSESCAGTADCCPSQALTAAPFASGAGTAQSPYVICTATQLDQVRTSLASSYFLGRDIDLAGVDLAPIGSQAQPFKGVFDGAFHSLSHFTYAAPTASYVGLFRRSNGTIKQLHLEDVDVEGGDYVGALCGSSSARIRDVTVSGTVRGNNVVGGLVGIIDTFDVIAVRSAAAVHGLETVGGVAGYVIYGDLIDAESTGSVTGTRYVGGVLGQVGTQGIVVGASSSATVSGTDYVGGVAGAHSGFAVTRSSSTGSVTGSTYVGGAVGTNYSGLFDAWSTSEVDATSNVGGLVGRNDGLVARAFSAGAVAGSANTGGLVGAGTGSVRRGFWDVTASTWASSAGGVGLTSDAMRDSATYAEWDTYLVWEIVDGALPAFREHAKPCHVGAAAFSGGAGTQANPYVITQPAQLYDVSCNLSASYVLGGPLDFQGIPATPPIGSLGMNDTATTNFTGTFDGAGFAISHWSGYGTGGGLFLFASGATIKNLRLEAVDVGGGVGVGAIAGNAFSTTLSKLAAQGAVFGNYVTGGITGNFSGTGSLLAADVEVGGGGYTGGVVGFCNTGSQLRDSYAVGSVARTFNGGFSGAGFAGGGNGDGGCTITRSYAAMAVSGYSFSGFAQGVPSTNSFWDSEVSGITSGASGTPKTTSEMKTQSTFVGWDFDTIWRIEPGSYPTLR